MDADLTPTLRYDRAGYFLGDESVDGFADRVDLSRAARIVLARLARAYAPDELDEAQRALLAEFDREEPPQASDLLKALADDEYDFEEAVAAGLFSQLTDDQIETVRDPSSVLAGRGYPLKIGEVCTLSRATPQKLRHWEELGLLRSSRVNGQRRYFRGAVIRAMVLEGQEQYEIAYMAAVAGGRGSVVTLAEIFSASPEIDREAVGVDFLRAAQFLLGKRSLEDRLFALRREATAEPRGGSVRYVFPRDSEWAIADALPRSPVEEFSGLFKRKLDAISCAKELVSELGGGEVMVHHKSGGFQLLDVGPRAHAGTADGHHGRS